MTVTALDVDGERAPYVHPDGRCESRAVGEGTRVWAFAHVLPGAAIGRNCNICDHAFVEGAATIGDRVTVKNGVLIWDGVSIEDDAFIGPAVVFTNDLTPRAHVRKHGEELLRTVVRCGATIGANATIVCGITIGRHAFVAAGSVVTRDVGDHVLVAGNPARPAGFVCRCGRPLDDELACSCGRTYHLRDGSLTDAAATPHLEGEATCQTR